MKKLVIIIFLAAMIMASGASAQLPKTINYQGVLTDNAGTVVTDGNYSLTFKLYTVPTGGSSVWNCTKTVTVTKGIFNAVLGETCALTPSFDDQYYLGISVEVGAELTPRTALTASAYSLNSLAVTGTDNVFPATGNVGIGAASPDTYSKLHLLLPNSGDFANLKIESPASNVGYGLKFQNPDDSWYVGPNIGNYPDNRFRIAAFAGSADMVILHTGETGIGITTPAEMLDVDGGIKLANSSGTNSGTMRWSGTDFEGYDGSSWTSFTDIGSGSLPSGTSGQTLRHNGTSWVANSGIYNNGTYIGIGDVTPETKLNIGGGQWDLDATEGDFKIGNSTYRLKFGVATGGGGAGTAGIRVQGGVETLKIGAGSTEVLSIESDGTLGVGSSTQDGILDLYANGITNPIAKIYPFFTHGGQMRLYDELGNSTILLEPDSQGEGGYFFLKRNATSTGFRIDGNYESSENPLVAIIGASNSVTFNMNETGNSSVALPVSSISKSEILDEPGGASYGSSIGVSLSSGFTTIASQSITTPAAGYVLVIGTTQAQANHTNGTRSWADFGVSTSSTSVPSNQTTGLEWPKELPSSGLYRVPVTVQRIFELASAGSYTFYFLGSEFFGSFNCYDIQLSLIYFPTAYGTISTVAMVETNTDDDKVTDPEITESFVANQKRESEAANNARIQRELAEMKARMERLEREMENNR